MTTSDISSAVIRDLADRHFPIYLTSFSGQGFSEADVLGISQSGFMYEFEIKNSRSDFKADLKNKWHKHGLLERGEAIAVLDEWKKGKRTGNTLKKICLPNRFYYVCVEGLLSPYEIPEYAGLIYVLNQSVTEIKPSKLLHKNKADLTIYRRIANILSERVAFGCAYATFKFKNK